MSNAKHTPGPWEIERSPLNPNPRIFGSGKLVVIVPKGVAFAAETEGNARLIAAAPELLEALEAIRLALCGDQSSYAATEPLRVLAARYQTGPCHDRTDQCVQVARAAILKATGEGQS